MKKSKPTLRERAQESLSRITNSEHLETWERHVAEEAWQAGRRAGIAEERRRGR
jgi:hypothetical protein